MRSYSEFLIIRHLNFDLSVLHSKQKVCELNHLRAALHKPRQLACMQWSEPNCVCDLSGVLDVRKLCFRSVHDQNLRVLGPPMLGWQRGSSHNTKLSGNWKSRGREREWKKETEDYYPTCMRDGWTVCWLGLEQHGWIFHHEVSGTQWVIIFIPAHIESWNKVSVATHVLNPELEHELTYPASVRGCAFC